MRFLFSIENSLDNFSHAGGLGILMNDLFQEFRKKEKEAFFFSILPLKRRKIRIVENRVDEINEEKRINPEYCYQFHTNWYPVNVYISESPESTEKTKAIFVTVENNEEWIKNFALYRERDEGQIIFIRYVFYLGVKKYIEENRLHPEIIHINESDTALFLYLPIELGINPLKIYHSHTPLPIGHKSVSKKVASSLLPDELMKFLKVGEEGERINLGKVAAYYSDKIVTVSELHEKITRNRIYPEFQYKISHVTNGINIEEWLGEEIKRLYDEEIPGWSENLNLIEENVKKIEDWKIREARDKEKTKMIEKMNELLKSGEAIGNFDKNKINLVYAKRLTYYKRPDASLKAYDFLKKFLDINLIIAGYPVDEYGKYFLENKVIPLTKKDSESVLYIPNYEKKIAKFIFRGADICLNPQEVESEASGTSYMKGLINGCLLVTTRAGSVSEFVKDGYNALVLSDNLENLEEKLLEAAKIINEKDIKISKNAMGTIYRVSTERMLKDLEKVYSRN